MNFTMALGKNVHDLSHIKFSYFFNENVHVNKQPVMCVGIKCAPQINKWNNARVGWLVFIGNNLNKLSFPLFLAHHYYL